jgi:hypothetical protein
MKQIAISDQEGIIDYWQTLGKYTITFSIPDTIDSHVVCIIPDEKILPEAFRNPGIKVLFSATLEEGSPLLPPPAMGGQTLLLIHEIHHIKSLESIY